MRDGGGSSSGGSFTHWLVMDYEATCEKDAKAWPNEIIEWPCVLVDCASGKVVDEFRSMVRPTERPTLTGFCTELTSITQGQVRRATSADVRFA